MSARTTTTAAALGLADPTRDAIVTTVTGTSTSTAAARLGTFLADEMTHKVFSSGAVGFYAGGKVAIDGVRYQVSVNVVAVGTKTS